jgi:hypothetical protein
LACNTLRSAATIEGFWLALLGWQAALKCARRGGCIGWPRAPHQQGHLTGGALTFEMNERRLH